MNSITFGRYSPYNTFVHKLDPRDKILLLILLMVCIFFRPTVWSTTVLISGALIIFMIVVMIISRVSILKLLRSLLSMWFLILVLFALYIFIPNATYSFVAFTINGYNVYWDSFYKCGYIIIRLILMLSLTMVLTSTTKPMDLTYAFEWYMTPLKLIKFPAHEIAMTTSIALRFIPTLLEETDRIMKAQSSRGVDFSRGGIFKRFRALISLIVPLLVSAFQRSDELADAMEARGYIPNAKRSHYRKLTFTWRDIIAFLLVGCIFGGLLFVVIYDQKVAQIDLFSLLFKINLGW